MPASGLPTARLIALATPLALLGGAYMSQYVFGLYPCEMCWWQRYPHFAAAAFALMAWIRPPGRLFVGLAGLSLLVTGLIGAFHAGVEYGWWQGLTACSSNDLGSNPLDAIMNTPVVRCDVAPWSLLGISLAGWNFLVSTAAAIAIFALLGKEKA
ncbi:MAG: disulfide bond formation protein B [Novosphingobium sp.]